MKSRILGRTKVIYILLIGVFTIFRDKQTLVIEHLNMTADFLWTNIRVALVHVASKQGNNKRKLKAGSQRKYYNLKSQGLKTSEILAEYSELSREVNADAGIIEMNI